MAINSFHPQYSIMFGSWVEGDDSYDGEDAIKAKGTSYLPATSGQKEDGQGTGCGATEGDSAYESYKLRAVYPGDYADTVESSAGIMHRKPAEVELPDALIGMMDNASDLGEDIQILLQRISSYILRNGRVGILGDIRVKRDGTVKPVIILYSAVKSINWDDTLVGGENNDLRFVVIDESTYELKDDLSWESVTRWRVLALTNPNAEEDSIASIIQPNEDGEYPEGVYATALTDDEKTDVSSLQFEIPNVQGKMINEIPFSFANARDISANTSKPPLKSLAKTCLSIYRGEADYRQSLFMQGQDTLVRIGVVADEDEVVRTGAGARIDVPTAGDAKYIGVDSSGLSEQRESLQNDYTKAKEKSAKLMSETGTAESGEALKIRAAAGAASLPDIAKSGAAALEKVLKILAVWMDADPDEVVIKPNLEFTASIPDGTTLLQLAQAKAQGAPISDESIHAWLKENKFTILDYQDELARINLEAPRL